MQDNWMVKVEWPRSLGPNPKTEHSIPYIHVSEAEARRIAAEKQSALPATCLTRFVPEKMPDYLLPIDRYIDPDVQQHIDGLASSLLGDILGVPPVTTLK